MRSDTSASAPPPDLPGRHRTTRPPAARAGTVRGIRGNPIAIRLGKLADSAGTGALRVPGDLGGAIYLRQGEVVYARSRRTPGPAALPAPPGHVENAASPGPLERSMAVREATIDAAHELLATTSGQSVRLRFQMSATPRVDPAGSMSVEALLTELTRRQKIVDQMSGFITADSEVIPVPDLSSRAVRVSAGQWALLIRVGERATPRGLAAELGRSVFATTIEAAGLVALQLLSVTQTPPPRAGQAEARPPDRRWLAVSFLRAVTRP
jgi:hypothetical protein